MAPPVGPMAAGPVAVGAQWLIDKMYDRSRSRGKGGGSSNNGSISRRGPPPPPPGENGNQQPGNDFMEEDVHMDVQTGEPPAVNRPASFAPYVPTYNADGYAVPPGGYIPGQPSGSGGLSAGEYTAARRERQAARSSPLQGNVKTPQIVGPLQGLHPISPNTIITQGNGEVNPLFVNGPAYQAWLQQQGLSMRQVLPTQAASVAMESMQEERSRMEAALMAEHEQRIAAEKAVSKHDAVVKTLQELLTRREDDRRRAAMREAKGEIAEIARSFYIGSDSGRSRSGASGSSSATSVRSSNSSRITGLEVPAAAAPTVAYPPGPLTTNTPGTAPTIYGPMATNWRAPAAKAKAKATASRPSNTHAASETSSRSRSSITGYAGPLASAAAAGLPSGVYPLGPAILPHGATSTQSSLPPNPPSSHGSMYASSSIYQPASSSTQRPAATTRKGPGSSSSSVYVAAGKRIKKAD